MKRPLDIASSGHRAQNQLAMNDPPPVLIDLHSASSRRESQNAFRRRKKGTVATRPHSSAHHWTTLIDARATAGAGTSVWEAVFGAVEKTSKVHKLAALSAAAINAPS